LQSLNNITQPVINNCLAFVSTLNFLDAFDNSFTLQKRKKLFHI
jgi:hypothetical protein